MDYKEQLKINAENNFNNFREEELKNGNTEIFENAKKINIFTELHNYFTNNHSLEEKVCQFLCEDGERILDCLYERVLDSHSSVELWDDIGYVIEGYYEDNCYMKKLALNAKVNYDNFKTEMLKDKSPKEVYDNAFEIYVYREFHDYLTSEHLLDERVCERLCEEDCKILDVLFEGYRKSETASIDSWEGIEDLINTKYNDIYRSQESEDESVM